MSGLSGIGTQIKNALTWFKSNLIVDNLTSNRSDMALSAAKGKDLQDKINELNTKIYDFHHYYSLNQIGVNNNVTINQVLYAMEANAELWIYCADKTLINNIPANQVFVHIIKIGGVQHVECISLWGDTRYIAGYQSNGAILGWKKYTSQA